MANKYGIILIDYINQKEHKHKMQSTIERFNRAANKLKAKRIKIAWPARIPHTWQSIKTLRNQTMEI